MNSVVCTLFENHFHLGLAALANSLYRQGFRGQLYAGYRGALPPWAYTAQQNSSLNWPGATTYNIAEGMSIHFLPLEITTHFTNYKPTFMLRLWNGPAKNAEAIMYLDPDIVINCKWGFYNKWVTYGVALVHEIVVNDMPSTHPVRMQWKKVIEKSGRAVTHDITSYINAGFCGIEKQNIEFLHLWETFIKIGVEEYNADITKITAFDKTHPFCFLDQDSLNITAMCCNCPISEIGPEGMDFIHGGWTMAHAVGSPKPWKKKFLKSALGGNPPSIADKEYWKNINSPISMFSPAYTKLKLLSLNTASLLGRFYRRY